MAITDRQRTELHKACEEKMGPGPADTLMACLPPVGWADVATKHDLAAQLEILEHKLDAKINALRADMNGLRADLAGQMRGWFFAIVAAFAILLTLATTASHILGT